MTSLETRTSSRFTPPSLRGRLPVVAGIAAAGILLSDSTRRFGIQGELTLVAFAVVVLAFLSAQASTRMFLPSSVYEPRTSGHRLPPILLVLFLIWALLGIPMGKVGTDGYQNLVVDAMFVLGIAAAAAATTRRTPMRVLSAFWLAGLLAALVYLATVGIYGVNNDTIYSARSIAGSLLAAIGVTVARVAVLKKSSWPLFVMVLAVGLSLSRAASAIALILMMTFAVRGRRGYALVKSLLLGGLILTAVMLAYTYWQPFRDRFERSDGYEISGITVGTSGRSALWAAVFEHWTQSPWFGFGAGSSQTYVTQHFVTIAHPHNDYLRLLHDFGIIGLTLWAIAILGLLRGAYQRYKVSTGADQAIHLAAILEMIKLLLFMIANNPVVSGFGMLGLAAIMGVSIGRGTPDDSTSGAVPSGQPVRSSPRPRWRPSA